MRSSTAKTGLASRMRDWMSARRGAFTSGDLCDGLGAPSGQERASIQNALQDFIRRGEVAALPVACNRRQKYRYNSSWRPKMKGTNNRRIYKAMHVSSLFAASDIERLSGGGRSHIEKTIRSLVEGGHVQVVGRRSCAHGTGAERMYRVTDRNRFRVEVLR